jgi:chaperonin GroEL (HSP60 family)
MQKGSLEKLHWVEERSEGHYSLDIHLIVAVKEEGMNMTVVEVVQGVLLDDRWGQAGSTP